MNSGNKLFFSFLAGAAVGVLAASLISKEDREKFAGNLKEKAKTLRDKIAEELDELQGSKATSNKS